jgi:hypothetical protein
MDPPAEETTDQPRRKNVQAKGDYSTVPKNEVPAMKPAEKTRKNKIVTAGRTTAPDVHTYPQSFLRTIQLSLT